jgi:hypothetical protein
VVGAVHANAMPVILRTREEIDIWMARGEKKDEGGLAA